MIYCSVKPKVGFDRDGHAKKSLIHVNVYFKSYNRKTEFTFVAE